MKDSGIEWIGEIPESWQSCMPLRFCAVCENAASAYDQQLPYIALENIVAYTGELIGVAGDDQVDSNVLFFTEDQVLFGKLRPYLTKVVRPQHSGQCSSELLPISPLLFTRDYLFWLLANKGFIDVINSMSYGVKMPRTSWKQMGLIYCPVPSMRVQEKIASKLDEECGAIDETVTTIEKQIETLEKYRASVIHKAVTKGLDSSVPMKPSGVEWIGGIPEHWEIKRLKYLLEFFDNLRAPVEASLRSQDGGNLYLYYGASGAIDVIDDYNVEGEMLLIGEDGANLLRRTLPLVYIAEGRYWVNNHAHVLAPIKGSTHYYYYLLEACDYTTFITGSAQPKLSQQKLANVLLPEPPFEEQSAVADYLDSRTAAIDAVIETKRKQLDVLKRRRQSLIYEYVTGKRRMGEVE